MPIFSHSDASKIISLRNAKYKQDQVRTVLRLSQILLEHIVTMNVLEGITESIHEGSAEKPRSAPFLVYTRAFAEGRCEDVFKAVEAHKEHAKRKDPAKVPTKDSTAYCFETTVGDLKLPGIERLVELSDELAAKPVRKFFRKESIVCDMLNAMLGEGFRVKKEEEVVASMGHGHASVTLVEVRLSVEFTGCYSPKDISLAAGVSRFSPVGRAIQDLPNVTLSFNNDYESVFVSWPETLYPHWLSSKLSRSELATAEGLSPGAFDSPTIDVDEVTQAEREFIDAVLGPGQRL